MCVCVFVPLWKAAHRTCGLGEMELFCPCRLLIIWYGVLHGRSVCVSPFILYTLPESGDHSYLLLSATISIKIVMYYGDSR